MNDEQASSEEMEISVIDVSSVLQESNNKKRKRKRKAKNKEDRKEINEVKRKTEKYIKPTKRTQLYITDFMSMRNGKNNNIAEDELWGDHTKSKKGCRLIFNNVNGLCPKYKYAKVHIIAMQMVHFEADFMGLAETNIDWTMGTYKSQISNIFSKYLDQVKLGTASSTETFKSYYQPGGTCCISHHPWSNKTKMLNDPTGMGRWTESTLTGKQSKTVTIITAYSVCERSKTDRGTLTSYSQQWNIIKYSNPNESPDPKEQLWKDLTVRIKELKTKQHEIILMLDANDSTMKINSRFTKFIMENKLIDVLVDKHGTDNEPATSARGSTRIDYILATEKINEHVIACGILPIHDICFCDHRPVFADFDFACYLGNDSHKLHTMNDRIINGRDPRKIKMYISALTQRLNDSELENKLLTMTKSDYVFNDQSHEMLDDVDKEFQTIKLECEKACEMKVDSPWSPIFHRAYRNNIFWKIWLSQLKRNKILDTARERIATEDTELYIKEIPNCTNIRKFVNKKVNESRTFLEHVRTFAVELREQFLLEQAEMYANAGIKDKAKAIMQQRRKEERGRMYKKLEHIMNPGKKKGPLTCIIQTNSDGEEILVFDPEIISKMIIERNELHFSQSEGTPLTVEPLYSLLGPYATSEFCEKILHGTIDIDSLELDEATKCFLKQLKRNTDIPKIKLEITIKELILSYMKWRESTTTSPSGNHLGHEKAVLRFRKEQELQAEEDGTEPLYMRVFKIKATLLNLALKHNHSYQRWAYVVNAMIEKIPGYPKPEKLRVIHLLESDFNILIGILWGRRLLHLGEDHKLIDDGQGGSRPDHRTQELLVQKHLTYSIWRMSRQTGISFDNDAKSCFDRIVMTAASLCSQQIGMPKEACELFLNTLNQMKYHIKTAYGVSETSYSSDNTRKMHGPGQGGRGSPCIWLIISSTLMKCMKVVNTGAYIGDPYNKEKEFLQAITGFVDDITHWYASNNTLENPTDTLEHMQKTAQWWEQLLHTSGGKLELSKCFYYLIEWKFDNEGNAHMVYPRLTREKDFTHIVEQELESDREITIVDSESGKNFNIPRKPCNESHKTLGVLETPNGNYKDEYTRLMKKSQGFAQRVSTASLNCWEARTLYFQMFLPSINYSATIGTLNENSANSIQASATKQCLLRMGYNRCLPNAVAYGPPYLGGIGLHHLFAEQGSAKAGFIIRMLRTDRPAGQLISRQLKWAQRCAGISKSILVDTVTKIPQLDQELWVTTLREFLYKSNVTIHIKDMMVCELQCANDRYIMDIALQSSLTKREKININKCRYYLHATTLSDITNASGTHISKEAYELSDNAKIDTEGLWPTQPHCGKVSIRHWKKFLLSLCVNDTLLLDEKLGEWTVQNVRRKISNVATISLSNKKAAIKIDNMWSNSDIEHNRRYSTTSWRFQSPLSYNIQSWIPASVKKVRDTLVSIHWRKKLFSTPSITIVDEWEKYLNELNDWERSIIVHTKLQESALRLKEILESDTTITIVSKGTCTDNNGTFAWVLDYGDTPLAHCQGRAFGQPMTTQRAAGISKLSWLVFLEHFSIFHKITAKCRVLNFCENKVVIKQTNSSNYNKTVASAMIANYDVMNEILQRINQLGTNNILIRDTRQIAKNDTNGLVLSQVEFMDDLTEMLNQDVIKNLKNYTIANNVHMQTCRTYLCIDGEPISSNETIILRWRWSEFILQDYYSKTWKIKRNDLKLINWAGIRIARNRISPGQYAFSIKQSIGWLSTGKKLKQYGNIITTCPLCGWDEDEHHLLLCDHRRSKMKAFIDEFELYLDTLNTDPIITMALLNGITRYFGLQNYRIGEVNNESDNLIKNQNIVGWNKFFQGFIHCNFAIKQEDYFKRCGKELLGDYWSGKISAYWIEKSHIIWKERNEIIHESEDGSHREAEEIRLHVRRLYGLKDLLSERDREIFDFSLERRLKQPVHLLEIWLDSIGPIVEKCIDLHSEELVRTNRTIDEFFIREQRKDDTANNMEVINLNDLNQENDIYNEENEIQTNMIRSRTGDINENLMKSGSTFVVTQVDTRE